MLIAATGDFHLPVHFSLFVKSMEDLKVDPDLFLIVGDVIDRGKIEEFRKVCNTFFGKINCPIISIFGNNEFQQLRDRIKEQNPEIKFLDDEALTLEIQDKKVGIVGTQGSLDRPTFWQRKNVPDIVEVYKKRIQKIKDLLSRLKVDLKILMIHYPPTYKILEGEAYWAFPELGCSEMERVLVEERPDFVVTGHAHRGRKLVWINGIPVFNVALVLNKEIVMIDTEKDLKTGLEKFF